MHKVSNENLAPNCIKRSRVFSTALPSLSEKSSEEPRSASQHVEHVEMKTWSGKTPDHHQKGLSFPTSSPQHGYLAAGMDTESGLSTPRSCEAVHEQLSPDADAFLEYMNNSLRLKVTPYPASPPSYTTRVRDTPRVRETSSSYDSEIVPRVQSPASPPHYNTLREVDIAKYSESRHCLSDLHSSGAESAEDDTSDAVEEAAAVINKWQSVPRSKETTYNQYELADSQEVLPSDSVSQANNSPPALVEKKSPTRRILELINAPRPSFSESIHAMRLQYDGVGDIRNQDSPNPEAVPRPMYSHDVPRGNKRKASQFSLRSLSGHLPSKARKLKDLANTVIHEGGRKLSEARKKLKQQKEIEKKRFEAWKVNQRKNKPADALKGKPEPGFSFLKFSLEQTRHGHKDWWQEGVRHHEAPSWMKFGGQRGSKEQSGSKSRGV